MFAGTTHPYPDDTFKFYLHSWPSNLQGTNLVHWYQNIPPIPDWRHCTDVAQLLASVVCVGITSPEIKRRNQEETVK